MNPRCRGGKPFYRRQILKGAPQVSDCPATRLRLGQPVSGAFDVDSEVELLGLVEVRVGGDGFLQVTRCSMGVTELGVRYITVSQSDMAASDRSAHSIPTSHH